MHNSDHSKKKSNRKSKKKSNRKSNRKSKKRVATPHENPIYNVRREWSARAHFQERVDQLGLDNDVVVEPPVRITRHAQQRIREGRKGKYIWKKQQNRVVIVTKLPEGTATSLPRTHKSRKQPPSIFRAK